LQDQGGGKERRKLLLNLVQEALEQADISVINLLNILQEKAQEYYQKNLYIYWRDDVHWNARGVELTAQEMQKTNGSLS
jgi:SGNH hydrolase-like domain, acetyltransferase AlgX